MLTVAYLLARAAFGSRGLAEWHRQVMGWLVGRVCLPRVPVGGQGCVQGGGGFWATVSLLGQRGVWGATAVGSSRGQLSLLGVSPSCTLNQEFENAEGDEYVTELSAQGSPAPQHGPEVYVLPLTKVSLPMAKQPGRSGKPGWGRTPAC